MKKYLFLILSMIWYADVWAIVYDADTTIDYFADTYITIENGVNVNPANGYSITMNEPVYLYNHGVINAVIDTNAYNLFVYDSGNITGGIINTVGGNVTQIISGNNAVANLNVTGGGNFVVMVQNASNLNFSDIKDINATSFVIQDSWIVINDFSDWQNWGKNVTASGNIHLIIADKNTVNANGEYIQNLLGAESVNVQIQNLDASERTQIGNNFFLKVVRETNYDIIKDNDEKYSVIEEIKKDNPNDKLIRALNLAADSDEINQIKNKSYRFNHSILLRPIRVLNNLNLMNNIYDKNDFGLVFKPVYTISNKINSYGGHIYIGNHYNNLYFGAGLSLNKFHYVDNINDFSGLTYGTDVFLKQYIDKLWINGFGGFNLTKFNANYISSNTTLKRNPYGQSWYAGLDSGYNFNINDNFILCPFVGVVYQNYKVTDFSDKDFYIRGGAGLKYSFVTDGIKYEYGLDGAIVSSGNLYSSVKVGFWSVTDEAGATLSVGILKDDLDYYNYQLSLSAKMLF